MPGPRARWAIARRRRPRPTSDPPPTGKDPRSPTRSFAHEGCAEARRRRTRPGRWPALPDRRETRGSWPHRRPRRSRATSGRRGRPPAGSGSSAMDRGVEPARGAAGRTMLPRVAWRDRHVRTAPRRAGRRRLEGGQRRHASLSQASRSIGTADQGASILDENQRTMCAKLDKRRFSLADVLESVRTPPHTSPPVSGGHRQLT